MTVCIDRDHEYTAAKSHPSGQKVNTDCDPAAKLNQNTVYVYLCMVVLEGLAKVVQCVPSGHAMSPTRG